MSTTKNEVLDFLNRRWRKDSDWNCGNCYWFAQILKQRFPDDSKIYYLPIEGHFVTKIGKYYYDWTGNVDISLNESPILFDEIQRSEPKWYRRIIEDCMK